MSVGDLRLPCEHGRYDEHVLKDGRNVSQPKAIRMSKRGESFADVKMCKPRPATVADLVSALRAEGVLEREWRCLLGDAYGGPCQSTWNEPTPWLYNARHSLCGWELSVMEKELAEAQPFPPAGG